MADYPTTENSYVLGSGELYLAFVKDVAGKAEDQIIPLLKPSGAIDGGAEINYKPTMQTIEPANRPKFQIKIDEEATFKSGTMNFNSDNIGFVAPVKTTTDTTTKRVTTVVGGKSVIPDVYLRFIHVNNDGSKIMVTMPDCKCINGTKFSFDKKNQTVIDMEFASQTTMTDQGALTIDFIPAPTV